MRRRDTARDGGAAMHGGPAMPGGPTRRGRPAARGGGGKVSLTVFVALALAVAVGLATAASPFASASPDGLTRVAADKGFAENGNLRSIQEDAPIPGYALPGIGNAKLAKGLAGFVGTLVAFGLGLGVASVLRRTRRSSPRAPAAT